MVCQIWPPDKFWAIQVFKNIFENFKILTYKIWKNFWPIFDLFKYMKNVQEHQTGSVFVRGSNLTLFFILENSKFLSCYKFCQINFIPLRLRKAGRVWCGGARDTHWVTFQNWLTVTKTKQSLRSSCFFRSLWY